MTVYTTVSKMGQLDIFTKKNVYLNKPTEELPGFYWRDHIAVIGFGPFNSIHEAAEDYVRIVKMRQQVFNEPIEEPVLNVINVDFKNKLRVV